MVLFLLPIPRYTIASPIPPSPSFLITRKWEILSGTKKSIPFLNTRRVERPPESCATTPVNYNRDRLVFSINSLRISVTFSAENGTLIQKQMMWGTRAMESLSVMVERIRDGDADAYASIVRRFQDMAVGYGYSILRDFQMAEDAAQEAFFEAYRELAKLREPAAFPGWFRRIVFKHCDRLIRGKSLLQVPLEDAVIEDSAERSPTELIEQGEMKDRIWEAVESLPEHERTVVTLYYMSGHSQKEIGEFLDVPVGTIKKRLFSGRNRLRELLIDLVEDNLRERRPSRDETFANSIIELLKAARTGDLPRVKELLEQNPRLVGAKDPLGNTALILAVNSGHNEIAELLYDAGVRPDIYEAASIGRTDLVAEFIKDESSAIDQYSREG